MPDDLRPQFERCKQLLEAFGIPMYSLPGFEADDVIGALSRQAEAKGLETIIVSGDLDPLQLVTPLIKLMTTRQGFQNTVIYDEEMIRQRYGLRPDQMVDFKALKGDATDNIPGVPGVGEKTAAKLIAEHKNLEGVYADLGGYTPRLRESLAANKDQVLRSRELATICRCLSSWTARAGRHTTAPPCSNCSGISSSGASCLVCLPRTRTSRHRPRR